MGEKRQKKEGTIHDLQGQSVQGLTGEGGSPDAESWLATEDQV